MSLSAKTSQRTVEQAPPQEWSIEGSGLSLASFKEALSHWALAGSPSTLLRSEKDCESEFENFHIVTITSKDGLIYGYASYLKFEGGPLDEVLEGDEEGLFDTYTDRHGRHVPLSDIRHYDVFEEYREENGIIYINKIEVMTPQLGLGKKLLDHILSNEEAELCFLHAIENSASFFLRYGFETTGIRNGDYNPELVLALHR